MRKGKLAFLAFALAVGACAQNPKPLPVTAAAVAVPIAVPTPLVKPPAQPANDPEALAAAQRSLRALGYNAGKLGDLADPALERAILAFERDQGMAEDGYLTPAVADRLEAAHAALLKAAAESNRNALFAYSDGAVRRQPLGLLIAPPDGLVSDAPANFLLPLRPGSQAIYHLGHRATDGTVTPLITVTCRATRMGPANMAFAASDAIAVDCHGEGSRSLQWRAIYSSKVGAVLRLEDSAGQRELVAIRPITAGWPSAARIGLDWALTHVLETAMITPVQWSSTGVTSRFLISAVGPPLSGHDAGLAGRAATLPCRRYEMVQNGAASARYPGIACRQVNGLWSLPGGTAPFASPVNAIASRLAGPGLHSLHN